MEKPYDFTDLSNRTCSVCGRRLKMNLLAKKPEAKTCYKCFKKKVK